MGNVLGIDVGTSATKAVVADTAGSVLGSASATHPSSRPHPGWSEQDPRDWWRSACAASRQAIESAGIGPSTIAAVGISGQMHGSVLLDAAAAGSGGRSDDVLRPAILWNDQRTQEQCLAIERAAGGRAALVRLVGNAALPGFTLPKLAWVREHEPQIWARIAAVLLPKDYVRFRLTGEVATDVGDSSGTLLFDVDRRTWSDQAARTFGIDPALLPPVHESATIVGRASADGAATLGIEPGTPVVAGSGDNQCGAIGAGVVDPGIILATLGTSGVIYAPSRGPRRDLGSRGAPAGRVHTMCAADGAASGPGTWSITGCTLSASGALAWARDTLFGEVPYETLVAEAAVAPPGSEGLVFLPYLTGERCPHQDPTASGAWIGLTARHTRGHLVRAVLEGVALTMCQILEIVRSIGVEAAACRVGGGGARSALWREILSGALALPVETLDSEEGPALGAALLAGVGAGVWPDVANACRSAIRPISRSDPDPRLTGWAESAMPVFSACYSDLRDRMGALAAMR